MAEIVRMPKLSDTMTEGTVSKWLKKVGDKIKSGEILAEIDSDKATMEFESFYDGTLLYIGTPDKKSAPVDSILAIIGKEGEDVAKILDEEKKKQPSKQSTVDSKQETKKEKPTTSPVEKEKKVEQIAAQPVERATSTISDSMIKASPLAKKLAKEKNIRLSLIGGSGDEGRVIKKDIESYLHYSAISPSNGGGKGEAKESYTDEPVSQMRKTLAKRLSESKSTSPHFYLTMEINVEELVKMRETINAVSSTKISYNDLIIKAAAAALREHPKVNASWLGDVIRYNNHIHIGVAVAVEEGLIVPVVKFADGKTLSQIADEVKNFAQKAKEKKLQPKDWEGNTFTISNLGMFGIEEFTAIINPPDACILAVGGIKEIPVVKDGKIVPGVTMKLTLSCDHRMVDGATGADFLQTLKALLENPILFLGAKEI
ncbi:MAG: pyruvate dehydrogenase complex dihydrolipoamide acetyltransferase [Bacteroidetes bacterium]|nr:pyruvate dehydrogenase complex dihydrolipoamide acetyltransferase [Bacteroidota bacterium]